jgi:hypothetical protein
LTIRSIFDQLKFKNHCDYILRLYIFTDTLDHSKFKKCLLKGLLHSHQSQNSYVIFYFFNNIDIIALDHSGINPFIKDQLLDDALIKDERSYKYFKETGEWDTEYNRTNIQITEKKLTKNMLKIYFRVNLEIYSIIYVAHTKISFTHKLKKKPILNKLFEFLYLNIKDKIYNEVSKNVIYLNYYNIQKENSNPSENYNDLIHIKYDQIFNLLNINKKFNL